ncbi:MAG: PepSY-like domain-containing protein [Bacteroidales bacterium]
MKKFLLIVIALCSWQMFTFADNDKPVQLSQMPEKAQTFIKSHFDQKEISFSKMENEWFEKNYTVFFTNGESIEFDKNGEWIEIHSKVNGVQASVIPAPIRKYLEKNYPNEKVLKIDRDKNNTEVELSNHMDIKFDKNYQIIDIDN